MMALIPSGSWIWNLIDAAARSLLMAAAVAAGLKLLRLSNVLARKVAWSLVLCGALLMPVLAPWAANQSWMPKYGAVLPVQTWLSTLPSWSGSSWSGSFWSGSSWSRSFAPDQAAPMRRLFPARVESLPAGDSPREVQQTSLPASGDHFPAPSIAMDGRARVDGDTNAASPRRLSPSWRGTAALIYLAVAGMLLIRIAIGGLAAARLWIRATPVSGDARVRWSREVSSPVTVASGILLPEDYTSWDAEKLRIVLAHENSHVRQGDFYLQLGAALYAAMFWFSPLGWWLKRTLCDLSEAISDRAAVSEAANHASYAQVLLEFAALPRTTLIGVAMARPGRLSHRINRLLDEGTFRRAFAGGRARMVVAALLAPLALFATTSLIRVQAASQAPPAPAAPVSPAVPAVPPAAPVPASPDLLPPPSAPNEMAVPPAAPAVPSEPGAIPPPPATRAVAGISLGPGSYTLWAAQADGARSSQSSSSSSGSSGGHYSYSYSDNGESYALISGNDKHHIQFSGEWMEGRREQLDRARRVAHGDFLWFTRNGKSYIFDDPVIVGQIAAMYKPMEDLGRQQEELGRKQEELGSQQEKLGESMSQATVPTPDVAKEMAALNAAMAELNAAKGKNVTQEQIGDLQEKLAEVQGKLGSLQGEMGSRQGEIGARQGELGARQGKLGEQQGLLGAEQGRIAGEADLKVKSIIDQSLKDGKARPVE